ncbi:MAG: hypothetical protein ACTSRA_18880 [Promethearchaeota archaeon]
MFKLYDFAFFRLRDHFQSTETFYYYELKDNSNDSYKDDFLILIEQLEHEANSLGISSNFIIEFFYDYIKLNELCIYFDNLYNSIINEVFFEVKISSLVYFSISVFYYIFNSLILIIHAYFRIEANQFIESLLLLRNSQNKLNRALVILLEFLPAYKSLNYPTLKLFYQTVFFYEQEKGIYDSKYKKHFRNLEKYVKNLIELNIINPNSEVANLLREILSLNQKIEKELKYKRNNMVFTHGLNKIQIKGDDRNTLKGLFFELVENIIKLILEIMIDQKVLEDICRDLNSTIKQLSQRTSYSLQKMTDIDDSEGIGQNDAQNSNFINIEDYSDEEGLKEILEEIYKLKGKVNESIEFLKEKDFEKGIYVNLEKFANITNCLEKMLIENRILKDRELEEVPICKEKKKLLIMFYNAYRNKKTNFLQ